MASPPLPSASPSLHFAPLYSPSEFRFRCFHNFSTAIVSLHILTRSIRPILLRSEYTCAFFSNHEFRTEPSKSLRSQKDTPTACAPPPHLDFHFSLPPPPQNFSIPFFLRQCGLYRLSRALFRPKHPCFLFSPSLFLFLLP